MRDDERTAQLADDLRAEVFAMLDSEPGQDSGHAAYVASAVEKEFLRAMSVDPELLVRIAADSVAELRRCDVFRVFDANDRDTWQALAMHLRTHRPDLKEEIDDVLAELSA